MIPIRTRPDEISNDWIERAAAVTRQLDACVDDDESVAEDVRRTRHQKQAQIMNSSGNLWSELKPILMGWSHQKCWYSELRDDGSDYHVDHFRPKLRVRNSGEPDRDGYWWLAFEWTNYRLAVGWVNSGHKVDKVRKGKDDAFPLHPTSPVCRRPGEDISLEISVLLDPVSETDALLLDFDETGLPKSAALGWNAERVRDSIKLLHLDCPRMVAARQEVWRRCERHLTNALAALSVTASDFRPRDGKTAEDWMEEACLMMEPESPLSAVAIACATNSPHTWARRLPAKVAARRAGPGTTAS
ncbi:hypothetical protein SAMN04488570_1809 [Nocardioides scoriae]|uniref:TIGR02646 family protein n=1 Tax=Nocardioides scoriae TaxID=642780 RepID=A0A1H1RY12_9ACTN|nr:hypothetical protein SAMN04488570_1809 [Nocardioides scoriae]